MKLIFKFIFYLSFWLLLTPRPILASDQNIFGLHLTQTSDIESAAPVINSSNGKWGWVTIVIRQDQLDQGNWQDFFDKCRSLHLIPIIRIATLMENDYWSRPQLSNMSQIAEFLNQLNWPTQTQHVILFNEVNHGQEWGGQIDVEDYVDIFISTSQIFKNLNPNFFILGPGLDLASPDKMPDFLSAKTFYQKIYEYNPNYFDHLDGLASHSYPNHGFIGTPADTGQHSIQGYLWELDYLRSLGINFNKPVFITETGWPHQEGIIKNSDFYTTKTTADFLLKSFEIWSKDPNVFAVTPFIYNYPQSPFDHFSWLDEGGILYPEYQKIIDFPKLQNQPTQINKYEAVKMDLPLIIFQNHQYTGHLTLKNTGQTIWGKGETQFCLAPQSTQNIILSSICISPQQLIKPNQTIKLPFTFTVSNQPQIGKSFISWQNTSEFEIIPFYDSSTVYLPKTNIFQEISDLFKKINPFGSK
jgi:hypothetical protein